MLKPLDFTGFLANPYILTLFLIFFKLKKMYIYIESI